MSKENSAMLYRTLTIRQVFIMNQAKGIIVGTINRLQFNEWYSDALERRMLWQLIAIFGKVNWFLVTGCSHRVKSVIATIRKQITSNTDPFTNKTIKFIGTTGITD